MRRVVGRLTAVGVAVLLVAQVPVPAMAGEATALDDGCSRRGLVRGDDGLCHFPEVPTGEVPLVDAPFPDGSWFTVTDPQGDVRSAAGDVFDRPAADMTQVWWRVGPLGRPLARSLGRLNGIQAQDANLAKDGRYLTVVVQPAGNPLGRRPEKETLLFGIASDVNGKPANDGAVSPRTPFSFWNGIDTIHQGGQFSAGSFGAGSTELNGKGAFVQYYNTDSGLWMGADQADQAYTLILPIRNVGDTFRVFSQAVQGETPISDLVGGPFDPAGALPLDGIAGPPGSGCIELLQINPALVGDGTAPAALEYRVAGPPTDEWLFLDLDVLYNRDPLDLGRIEGEVDGPGFRFRVPLPGAGAYTIRGVAAGPEDGSDPFGWDRPARSTRMNAARFVLGEEGGFGHLAGSYNCGRDPFWMSTADACAPIGRPPDSWGPGEREYIPDDELLDRLEELESATLRGFGDDQFSACTVLDPGGVPATQFILFRERTTDAMGQELGAGLEREGCVVEPLVTNEFQIAFLQLCSGSQPSTAVLLADPTSGFGMLGRVPQEDRSFVDDMFALAPAFRGGVRVAVADFDRDGIADLADFDADNDGHPDGADRYPFDSVLW